MVVAMSMLQLFSVLLLTACSALPHSVTHTLDDHTEEGQNRQLKSQWASVFPGLTSTTVPLECEFKGGPICCSALKNTSTREPPSGVPLQLMSGLQRSGECVTKKEYFPSPYETRHFEKAKEIAQVPHVSNRHRLLMQFISLPEEVIAAQKWLERVRVHMSLKEAGENKSQRKGHLKSAHMQRLRNINANLTGRMHGRADKRRSDGDRRRADATGWLATSVHPDDAEYMSKFVLTTTCEGGASYQSTEWIEPLSVHARHPFGMSHCTYKETASVGKEMAKSGVSDIKKASLFSADYILLQEADSLPEYEVTSSKIVRKTKKYLFDAGTSRFDSSLFWFTCAFAQRFIDFDSIFGWEYSLLNPRDFWSHVPPRWKPLYHFFNKGITASPTDTDSVQTLLKQLGVTRNDFVAFKLDIDTPVIEVPIAMDLLNEDAGFGDLIDEFFFELHFRCEIMMYCGWNSEMPGEFNGLRMDRYGALQFFGDLRRRGIRAHFWP